MRFMKQRKTNTNAAAATNNNERTPKAESQRRRHAPPSDTKMEADDDADNSDASSEFSADDSNKYEAATSVDMYGMEAALIGRRSFRGFNAPLERMWTEARDDLKNRDATTRKTKVSDEELLRRYAESNGIRGVGNLDKKVSKKQQHRRGGKNKSGSLLR